MASPRLHTVKTGRIGPKVSCRMTASDVRTSVNSVGAVEGNKAADNSEARCPVTRCGLQASRRDIRRLRGRGGGQGLRVAARGGIGTLALPGRRALSGALGWGVEGEQLDSRSPQGSGCRTGSWSEF